MLIWDSDDIGKVIDSYKGIDAFENGYQFHHSQGKHFAEDGYYFGQKWQCVEYIKRFYKLALDHEFPDGMGHARSFYNNRLDHGALNEKRNLLQFNNHGDIAPQADDILVFQDTQYGHMGIVTQITDSEIEIIQQNIFGKPRQIFSLEISGRCYSVTSPRLAAGWMRKPAT